MLQLVLRRLIEFTSVCVCVQTLAIYDRFGRLMLGSEEQPKDVLEYLVIERHLINPYSRWRLHGKIVPSWAPAKDPIIKVTLYSKHLSFSKKKAEVQGSLPVKC